MSTHVLVVDDEQSLAKVVASYLERDGHQAELIGAAVAAANPRYTDKGVTLATAVAANLPEVDADVERMAQVLGNLLDNALRHTPAGGTVTADRDGSGVRITVADTGEGIAAKHLPHIVERFYRADDARDRGRGGSGIGLAIVRAIITEHGGRVTAHSNGPGTGTGTGTTLMITLPAADQPR